MAGESLLEQVKTGLGITGSYQDDTIQIYIEEATEFLRDAGVSEAVLSSSAATGVIVRGVADLWNLGSGKAELSTYFKQRAIQLALKT